MLNPLQHFVLQKNYQDFGPYSTSSLLSLRLLEMVCMILLPKIDTNGLAKRISASYQLQVQKKGFYSIKVLGD